MVWITTPAVTCTENYSLESLIKLLIRDSDCEPYVDCDTREGLEALVKQLFSVLPDGTLALNVCECDGGEPPVELALRLVFDDIANANTMIGGDSSDVADWNTFFDLPTNGTPFTSVTVTLNTVELFGGSNIALYSSEFDSDVVGNHLISIEDDLGCITTGSLADYVFYAQTNLVTANLPALTDLAVGVFLDCTALVDTDFTLLTQAGSQCFSNCSSLDSINFPVLTTAGNLLLENCSGLTSIGFPSCTDLGGLGNHVFDGITGNTITITIPHALEADGDIVWLKANNTVTVLYSD